MTIRKQSIFYSFAVITALMISSAYAAPKKKKSIGIADVKVSPSLATKMAQEKRMSSLQRFKDSLDGLLTHHLHQTRKFDVIARSDLKAILKEQAFARSGNVDKNSGAAESFKIAGVQYIVVAELSDYQDVTTVASFAALGKKVKRRTIRIGCLAKIYDTTTGKLYESVDVSYNTNDTKSSGSAMSLAATGDLSDEMIRQMAAGFSDKVANRVVEVFFPARVIGLTGAEIMINRGDKSSIAVGQKWGVYGLGEEMIDPDTGESLGRTESKVGVVEVVRVTPRFSSAKILENFGIQKLHVLRKEEK